MQKVLERLALELGITNPKSLSQWRRRGGVPPEHRMTLYLAAQARGIELDPATAFTGWRKIFDRGEPRPKKPPRERCPTCGRPIRHAVEDKASANLDKPSKCKKRLQSAEEQSCYVGIAAE